MSLLGLLGRKQFERGRSDGRAGHSPSLLRGPYMDGYVAGRSGRDDVVYEPPEATSVAPTFGGVPAAARAKKAEPVWDNYLVRKCAAKLRLRQPPCNKKADTVRRIEAAPGLWVVIPLCHHHQIVWDRARTWTHAQVFREEPCHCSYGDPCPRAGAGHKDDTCPE